MKTARTFAIIVFLIFAACSTTPMSNISYDYDAEADFESLETYAWLPFQNAWSMEDEWVLKRIKREVDGQLEAKGFGIASEDPDFLIALRGKRKRKVAGKGEVMHTYLEGKLVVVFLDAQSKKPIWRGIAEGALDSSPTPEERDRNIKRVITKMLGNFPPR